MTSAEPSELPSGRRRAFAALAMVLGLAAAMTGAEIFARVAHLPPRVPLVSADRVDGYRVTADGVVVWSVREPQLEPCRTRRPDARRISFFGTSITYGVGLPREASLPARIEARLNGVVPGGLCADDFAQPGFGTDQSLVRLRETVPATAPAVVVWEVWDPTKQYTPVGDHEFAFDARGRELDAANVPVSPFVPAALADPLFRHSRAYRYAVLATSRGAFDEQARITNICTSILPDIQRIATGAGARVVLLQATPLDRPFDEDRGPSLEALVVECGRRLGIASVGIAELLRGEDVVADRQDPCCHLNARGHEALANALAPRLLALATAP